MSTKQKTIAFATDAGEIFWVDDREEVEGQQKIAGGYLLGTPDLVNRAKQYLSQDDSARILWLDRPYSANRDTLADLVAAMVSTGNGRGVLNKAGWAILEAEMPELKDGHEDDEQESDVIY